MNGISRGYNPSIKWNKTNNFWLDVSTGIYEPSWQAAHVFGRNLAVPNGSWAIVANLGGATYPFPTTPTTVRVKAGGNAADTVDGAGARTIRVSGVDSNMELVEEDIVLAGASASASTTTSFWRVNSMTVLTCGTYATPYNTAAIIVENTAGTADLLKMEATEAKSLLSIFSVPTGITAVILNVAVNVDANKAADVRLFQRPNFDNVSSDIKSRLLINYWDGVESTAEFTGIHPTEKFVGPSDVWFEANGGGAITEVSVNYELFCYPTR